MKLKLHTNTFYLFNKTYGHWVFSECGNDLVKGSWMHDEIHLDFRRHFS